MFCRVHQLGDLDEDSTTRKPSITVTLSSLGGEEDEGVVVDEELLVSETWVCLTPEDLEQQVC